jgi:hypothetical protein
MKKANNKISLEQCCIYYEIETTFVQELGQHGLIELTRSGEQAFIDFGQLGNLEKYMHMHYDLDINMEGMEAITHLLNRVQSLQQEIKKLKGELEKK